jgi:putative transposase
MPDYKRTYKGGGMFFFTLVTHRRRHLFSKSTARKCLRQAILEEKEQHPFDLVAIVLLPDHLHCILELPVNDADFSKRWGRIKSSFSKMWMGTGGKEAEISQTRRIHRERGIWQKRFW